MKKVLALILAVLMLAALAVTAVSADDEYPTVDVRDLRIYGQDNTYLGDTPIAIAPTIDGKVELDEYQAEVVISKDGEEKWEYVSAEIPGDFKEYYAYDADNFYIAISVPQEKGASMMLFVNGFDSPDSKLYTVRKGFVFADDIAKLTWGTNMEATTSSGYAVSQRNIAIDLSNGGWLEGELLPAGTRVLSYTFSEADEEFSVDTGYDETTGYTTYELRISKKAFAKAFRTEGEDAVDTVNYFTVRYNVCTKNNQDDYWGDGLVTRCWVPETDENGNNASYILDDAGLAGGLLNHFVFAEAKHEHNFGDWTKYDDNQHVHECECGKISYADHTWNSGVVNGNEKIYTCTECSATKNEQIEIPPVTDFTLTVENKTVKLSDTVQLNVLLQNNPGIAGIVITLSYDTEALGTPTITNGEILSTMQGAVNIVFYNDTDSTANGVLASLSFTPTKAGEYEIGVKVRECTNIALDDVEVTAVNGTLTVLDYVYGDANGDEKVNLKDAVLIATYLANYDYDTGTSSVELEIGADANGDGKVNLKDAVLVATYIANYDYDTGTSTVVLGPVKESGSDNGWTTWH